MGLFVNREEPVEDVYEAPVEEVEEVEETVYEEEVVETEQKEEAPVMAEDNFNTEIAYISSGTTIEGVVKTQGSIILNGEVNGDIKADGNIELGGKIQGKIDCSNLIANGYAVLKDVTVENNIILKAGTTIDGDITCKNITVFGTVNGNIFASGSVVLKETAVVKGDVAAARLGIESGAKITGKIDIQ